MSWLNQLKSAADEVFSVLGSGYRESVYEEALAHELRLRGIAYERQRNFEILYKGYKVSEGRVDLILNPLWAGTSKAEAVVELEQAVARLEVRLGRSATDEEIAEIGRRLEAMYASMDDADRYSRCDVEFHLAIARAGRNRVLLQVVDTLRQLLRVWIVEVLLSYEDKAESYNQHVPIYEAIRARGASFLDAPISGGTAGAQAGTLTIMVGGDADAFERARPVFEAMGKNIKHVGPSGAGSVVKLVNQLLVAINMAGVVEGIVLGTKAGVDPNVMLEVLSTSFGGSAMLNRSVPLILERNFQPGTPVNLILKDMGLIKELGHELAVRLLLGSVAEEVFGEARALGWGEEDMAGLVRTLERLAGIEIKSPTRS